MSATSPSAATQASVPAVRSVAKPVDAPPDDPWAGRDLSWVWDIPFDRVTMDQAIERIGELIQRGKPSQVITANLNYVMLHHRDTEVEDASLDAAMIVADGFPVVARSSITQSPLPCRVAGSEMIYELAREAAKQFWPIYFLGGAPGIAKRCADRLTVLHPTLLVAGVESPPFRDLTDEEQSAQIERIRSSGAKILLVAFGQPKGEKWIHQHLHELDIPVAIQLGASFDFVAGHFKRAPLTWQRLRCEWLHRMLQDPRRLCPRYASNAWFLLTQCVLDWQRKVRRWGMDPFATPPDRRRSSPTDRSTDLDTVLESEPPSGTDTPVHSNAVSDSSFRTVQDRSDGGGRVAESNPAIDWTSSADAPNANR